MGSLLKHLWGSERKSPPVRRAGPRVHGDAAAIVYPSVDPGLPVLSVDHILEQNEDLIARIKLAYGSEIQAFSADLLPLIRRYAEFVHLLPATSDNYFCSPGGLFRLGLEIAFFSLQGTDGQIFSGRATILQRRELEPRWRKATFIAGLCHEIHRTLSHLVVTDSQGNEWPFYISALSTWLASTGADRYFLKWVPNAGEMRSLGVFALPRVVDNDTLQSLAQGNSVVVPQMMGSVSGMPCQREHGVLDQLVRRAAALVIDRDLRASADRYGKPILGSHLERYLLDGMRRLVADSEAWKPNAERSRVWYGSDGVFIVWPNAAADLAKLLEADQLPGIPKSSETILAILVAAGVVQPQNESRATWDIYPPNAKKSLEAIRLVFPDILFGASPASPVPIGASLLTPAPEAVASPAVPAPAPTPGTAPAVAVPAVDGRTPAGQHQLPLRFDRSRRPSSTAASDGENAAPADHDAGAPGIGIDDVIAPAPDQAATPGADDSPPIRFAFLSPARLNPSIREAIEDIIGTMNGNPADVAARTVAQGVFVPLKAFERRKVEPAIAVRALAELAALAITAGTQAKTAVHEFCGERLSGVVILPQFVAGLCPADFAITCPEEVR
ncbi:MAG: TraI domain-containing protein [Sterolibacteriaceae bacterium]|nr:TraI domain-containing protein [Sterolibacteriaceae bacterium]